MGVDWRRRMRGRKHSWRIEQLKGCPTTSPLQAVVRSPCDSFGFAISRSGQALSRPALANGFGMTLIYGNGEKERFGPPLRMQWAG